VAKLPECAGKVDAVSRLGSQGSGGEVGRLAERCTRVWDLCDAAFREDDTPGPGSLSNAVSEPWSNGQTEGQINKLKTFKRAMYARAGVDLLRARMMPL
jgi:hypothetical protein